MASDKAAGLRRYNEKLKAEVMGRGINATVVLRWRLLAREGDQANVAKPREFVAMAIEAQVIPQGEVGRGIEIELRRWRWR
jgi:hypothetical protein